MKTKAFPIKVLDLLNLIQLAELNWYICNQLYNKKINKKYPNKPSLVRLIANNCFHEAVSIMYSLFVGSDKRELSIRSVLEQCSSHKLDELEQIAKKFKAGDFLKVRNQSSDHKNEFLRDPAGAPTLLLGTQLVSSLGEIICELRDAYCKWFQYSKHNPNFAISEEIIFLPDNS